MNHGNALLAESIVNNLIQKKVSISTHNGELLLKAEKATLTPELINLIKENKSSIIAYLEESVKAEYHESRLLIKILNRSRNFKTEASFAQQRMWIMDRIGGDKSQYNIPVCFRVEGKFCIHNAEMSIKSIIDRHEVLRTTIIEEQGTIKQLVNEVYDFSIASYDLSFLDGLSKKPKSESILYNESIRKFDLSRDLMVRCTYIKLSSESGEEQGIILFVIHHIASDGWSIAIFCKEFMENYQNLIDGKLLPNAELDIQYADYSYWQAQWLKSEEFERQFAYWEKQLADLPSIHGLTLDKPRPRIKQHQGRQIESVISEDVSTKIKNLSTGMNLTPFMLLHGALALVLSRHTNTSDIVMGTPVANRPISELDNSIGLFFNTLVLRVNTHITKLKPYFQHVKDIHIEAQKNQAVPFEKLVERLHVTRDMSSNPLFQILLTTESEYGVGEIQDAIRNGESKFIPFGAVNSIVKFDLDIHLAIRSDRIVVSWIYDPDIFDEERIKNLDDHLIRFLTNLAEADLRSEDIDIKNVEMLSKKEVDLLTGILQGRNTLLNTETIAHLFERQTKNNPENQALVHQGKSFSYQELNGKANRLANYLISKGVKNNIPIGISIKKSLDLVVSMLAVIKSGGAYVPIDPSAPEKRRDSLIEDIGLEHILTDSEDKYSNAIRIDDPKFKEHLQSFSDKDPQLNMGDIAYIMYTSGSTGQPKGVIIEHQALTNFIHAMNRRFENYIGLGFNFLATTTYTFDVAAFEIFSPLTSGGTVILSTDDESINTTSLIKLLEEYNIRAFQTTPVKWKLLIDSGWSGKSDLLAVSCGEALSLKLAKELLPRCERLINAYGPTEATVYSLVSQVNESELKYNVVTIGEPLDNYSHIVLTTNNEICPYGVAGELCIGGVGLARAYANKPDITNERFIYIDLPGQGTKRFYRTGDIVRYLPNGKLEYLGRSDNQVKIHGLRIELEEIEFQLNKLEVVSSSLTLSIQDDDGEKRLVAYVVPNIDIKQDLREFKHGLRKKLQQSLPFHMIPWDFIFIKEWPLNVNGKIDRKRLPSLKVFNQAEFKAPETDIQKQLSGIWAQLLGVPFESIGIYDNFFEMGGHSILAIKLVHEIQSTFGLSGDSIGITDVFELISLFELSDRIELAKIKKKNRQVGAMVEKLELLEEGEF